MTAVTVPTGIDEQLQKAWLPFSIGEMKILWMLDVFACEVAGLLPMLDFIQLPVVDAHMLFDVVHRKKPSADDTDAWGWKELTVLNKEEDGVLDPRGGREGVFLMLTIVMMPKSDGDATPLGQRPLCVTPVVNKLWACVRANTSG